MLRQPRPFLIEEKLDGERIQLHKKGEEYRYFSRKDKDYTYLYGMDWTTAEGSLTPFIHECFSKEIDEYA
jgi:DNA ligase-4